MSGIISSVLVMLILASLATWRCVQMGKQFVRGELRARSGFGFFSLIGSFAYAVFALVVLAFWLVVVGSLFFMKTGGASGVPFALALVAVPITYLCCELFVQLGFVYFPQPACREKSS